MLLNYINLKEYATDSAIEHVICVSSVVELIKLYFSDCHMNVSAPSVDITQPITFTKNLENIEPTNLDVVQTSASKKSFTGKRIIVF